MPDSTSDSSGEYSSCEGSDSNQESDGGNGSSNYDGDNDSGLETIVADGSSDDDCNNENSESSSDEQSIYELPFPEDVEKKIGKPTGKYAHENFPESRYAVDFLLDVDTPILAARGGKVTQVKSDSDKWGLDSKFIDEANYVGICHGDGSVSV
ncbi:hypothetical protein HYU06_04785 [Candidatus Woesearchaeota archaeon]|nr:hypothetical protein [Candidatus Woesearchaeota archaeon]